MSHVPESVTPSTSERRMLRLHEVEAKAGFKRAHIYNLMRQGKFPKQHRIGVRAVRWDSVEIEEWVSNRLNSPR